MFCKRLPISLLSAVLALALSAGTAGATTTPGRGGDFTLNGPDGPVSLSDLRGKVVLIFFGYTSCPDVCPISLARINACFSAMDEMELERVRALFITLDPERDTPDRLEQYTSYFHANIIGLRDDVDTINAVTDRYGVEYAKKELPDSALGYSISHPTDIFLLDTSGRLVEQVPHDTEPKYLLARIRDLLNASD
ncbi:MAG: SCO family protein [Gammaproteobacteria bacterium]|nr:SCO family protein [Gammaproteobacteria bacterium]